MSGRVEIVLLRIASGICAVLNGVMIGIVLIYTTWFIASFADNAESYSYIEKTLLAERVVSHTVREAIPTTFAGRDLSRWIAVMSAMLLSGFFNRWSERLYSRSAYIGYRVGFEQWKERMDLSDAAIVLSPLHRTLEELKTAKRKDRERLLRDFAHAKKQLDAMGRRLAFLAIDVVDSTGLKAGEEPAVAENDFRQYRRYVERLLDARDCMKAAWTPDGAMCCFATAEAAASAARDIIGGLGRFNREVKQIRREFSVRCGINAGFVYYDDSVKLEELSDRTIDIAGHMQKQAAPNTICAARPAMEPVIPGFEPSGKVVDGFEVYVWEGRRVAAAAR